MFPGYVTLYKDNKGSAHLYFYQGLCDDGNPYYHPLDTSDWTIEHEVVKHNDGAVEYIFSVDIKRVICKLIDMHNTKHTVELKL